MGRRASVLHAIRWLGTVCAFLAGASLCLQPGCADEDACRVYVTCDECIVAPRPCSWCPATSECTNFDTCAAVAVTMTSGSCECPPGGCGTGDCLFTSDGTCDEPDICDPGTDSADCGGTGETCFTSEECGCGMWCNLSTECEDGGPTDERWCCSDGDCPSEYACNNCGCIPEYQLECEDDLDCGLTEECIGGSCKFDNSVCY